jgi:hypothetical protein
MYPQKVIVCEVNSAVMCYYHDAEIENSVCVRLCQSAKLARFAFELFSQISLKIIRQGQR